MLSVTIWLKPVSRRVRRSRRLGVYCLQLQTVLNTETKAIYHGQ